MDGYGGPTLRPDALITLNDQPAAVALQRSFSIPASRSVLVLLEPRVTAPQMYTKSVVGRYGLRFAASPLWAAEIDASPFLWPQTFVLGPRQESRHQFDATMINAEKRSAVEGSLYGLRRAVIKEMDERGMDLAIFGPGWDSAPSARLRQGAKATARAIAAGLHPQVGEAFGDLAIWPRRWQGQIQNKAAAFSKAPVSVIIENSADYVSEKLVDAVSAGVVPMYVGPRLDLFGLPTDLVIECPSEPQKFVSAIERRNTSRLSEVAAAGREWLRSEQAERHEIRNVLAALGADIGQLLSRT